MRLYVEEVAAVNRVAFDFIEDYLAAEVFVTKIKCHFGDGISFNLIIIELCPIVSYDFLDLLVYSVEVVLALEDPLTLTVIL